MTRWLSLALVMVLVVAGAACSTDTVPEAREGPASVVDSFYGWYLENAGFDPETQSQRNPLQEGMYRDREELTAEFVARLDEIVAVPEGMMADPLLCAQDVPESVEPGEPLVEGDRATVPVTTSFANHGFSVDLVQADGVWRIDAVTCGTP